MLSERLAVVGTQKVKDPIAPQDAEVRKRKSRFGKRDDTPVEVAIGFHLCTIAQLGMHLQTGVDKVYFQKDGE